MSIARRELITFGQANRNTQNEGGYEGIGVHNAREILGKVFPQVYSSLHRHDFENFRGKDYAFSLPMKDMSTGKTVRRGFLETDFGDPAQVQFLRNVAKIMEDLKVNMQKSIPTRIERFMRWLANEAR